MNETVLLVDDEPSLRETLAVFLADAGYRVSTASVYEDACALIEKDCFDAVVTDILLAEKSGIDLLRLAKERNPLCRIIVITGYPTDETIAECERLGASGYLPKPVRKDEILETVARAFERGRDPK